MNATEAGDADALLRARDATQNLKRARVIGRCVVHVLRPIDVRCYVSGRVGYGRWLRRIYDIMFFWKDSPHVTRQTEGRCDADPLIKT